jgi:hypothetical protein
MPAPVTTLPQPTAKGSTAAGAFAGLVCFLDGLLLLGVALTQITGGGFGILVGLWNIAVTVAYMVVTWELFTCATWSYGAGMGLGLLNLGFVCFQLRLIGLVDATMGGISESAATIPLLFMAGDTVLMVALFALKNAIIPPPPSAEVPVSPTLLARLDQALAQGQISAHEKDLFDATYRAFVTEMKSSRALQVETDLEIGGERVDVKVYHIFDSIVGGSRDASSILYLFRPVVDTNLKEWMKHTIWRSMSSGVAIVCIRASAQAMNSAGWKPMVGIVGLYGLRGNLKAKGEQSALKEFVKFFEKTPMYYGQLLPELLPAPTLGVGDSLKEG